MFTPEELAILNKITTHPDVLEAIKTFSWFTLRYQEECAKKFPGVKITKEHTDSFVEYIIGLDKHLEFNPF